MSRAFSILLTLSLLFVSLCCAAGTPAGRSGNGLAITPDKTPVVQRIMETEPDLPGWTTDAISIDGAVVRAAYVGPDGVRVGVVLSPLDDGARCDLALANACLTSDSSSHGPMLLRHVASRFEAASESLWSQASRAPTTLDQERLRLEEQDRLALATQEADAMSPDERLRRTEAMVLSGLWLLFFGLLAARLWAERKEFSGQDLGWAALLLAVALGLRLAFATWGPGDIRQVDDGFIGTGDNTNNYGLTTSVLGRAFLFLPVTRDRLLVLVSLIPGAFAPLFVWRSARRLGLAASASLAAGLVIAVHPWLVRSSGEAGRMGLVLFLGSAALWAFLDARRHWRWSSLVLAVAASGLVLRARPEAFLLVGFLALFQFLAPRPVTRLAVAGRAAMAALLAALALAQRWLLQIAGHWNQADMSASRAVEKLFSLIEFPYRPEVVNHLDLNFTPALFILLFLVGAVTAVRQRHFWALWSVVALVLFSIPFSGVPRAPAGDMQLASARYQTLTYIPFALLVALGVAWLTPRMARLRFRPRVARTALAALAGAAVVSVAVPMERVVRPTAQDHEYALLREVVRGLPANAEIFAVFDFPGDVGLMPPTSLSGAMGRSDVVWRAWPHDYRPSHRPQFLVMQSACWLLLQQQADSVGFGAAMVPGQPNSCAAARRFVSENRGLPWSELTVELRDYLMAREGERQVVLGIYRITPEAVDVSLLDPALTDERRGKPAEEPPHRPTTPQAAVLVGPWARIVPSGR